MRFYLKTALLIAGLAGSAYAGPAGPPAGAPILNQSYRQQGAVLNIASGTIDNVQTNTIKFNTGTTLGATAGAAVNLKLPNSNGTSGQFLRTDGTGNLSFATPISTLTVGAVSLVVSQDGVVKSSPTSTFNFLSPLTVTLTGAATAQVSMSNNLPAGATNYIWNGSAFQTGSVFNVSSGTVGGVLYINGGSSFTEGLFATSSSGYTTGFFENKNVGSSAVALQAQYDGVNGTALYGTADNANAKAISGSSIYGTAGYFDSPFGKALDVVGTSKFESLSANSLVMTDANKNLTSLSSMTFLTPTSILPSGATSYIQNSAIPQANSNFNVSTGAVQGPLTVGGVMYAGSNAVQITKLTGNLDATTLVSDVPLTSLNNAIQNTGAYQTDALFNVSSATVLHQLVVDSIKFSRDATVQVSSPSAAVGGGASSMAVQLGGVNLSSPTVALNLSTYVFTGNQSPTGTSNISLNASSVTLQGNLLNVANRLVQLNGTAQLPAVSGALVTQLNAGAISSGQVPAGNLTNAILNQNTLQSGATFYVSSGTVAGQLSVKSIEWSDGTVQVSSPSESGGGGGGMAIGGAVSGGTPTDVLYVDGSGNLGQDDKVQISPNGTGGVASYDVMSLVGPADGSQGDILGINCKHGDGFRNALTIYTYSKFNPYNPGFQTTTFDYNGDLGITNYAGAGTNITLAKYGGGDTNPQISGVGFTLNYLGGVSASNITDSALASGQCVQTGTGGLLTVTGSACGAGGGGGASTLAVGTGTASNYTNQVTSPTAVISFRGTQFNSLAAGTTNIISLAPVVTAGTYGSATISPTITFNAQGQIIAASSNTISATMTSGSTSYIQNTNSLQSGATFYVSSGTVAGDLNITNAGNLNLGSFSFLGYGTNGNPSYPLDFEGDSGDVSPLAYFSHSNGTALQVYGQGSNIGLESFNTTGAGPAFRSQTTSGIAAQLQSIAPTGLPLKIIGDASQTEILTDWRKGIVRVASMSANGDIYANSVNTPTLKFNDGTTQTTAATSNYIQNTNSLQAGATFYVSSGTVAGNLKVGSQLTVGGQVIGTGLISGYNVVANSANGQFFIGNDNSTPSPLHPNWTPLFLSYYPNTDTRIWGEGFFGLYVGTASAGNVPPGKAYMAIGASTGYFNQLDTTNYFLVDVSTYGTTIGNVTIPKTLTVSTINVTTNLLANGASGNSGQYLQSSGAGVAPTWQTVAAGGGGGSSTLATGIGTTSSYTNQYSSPTAILSFNNAQFTGQLLGTATGFYSLNTSSVTLYGPAIPASALTGPAPATMLVSSFPVTGVTPGSYTLASITVGADGRLSSAATGSATGSVAGSSGCFTTRYDGSGSAVVAGSTSTVWVPYGITITTWTFGNDSGVSGTISVHVSSSSTADWDAQRFTKVSGSTALAISSGYRGSGSTSGWSQTVYNQGDWLSWVNDSAATLTKGFLETCYYRN
jgi:hypothetical protein